MVTCGECDREIEVDEPPTKSRRHGYRERGRQLHELSHIPTDDCVLWPHGKSVGYPMLVVGGADRKRGHAVVCEWWHGPPPTAKYEAAHDCGVPSCVNPRHLRWATSLENSADMERHGTKRKGERNTNVTLLEVQVNVIRQRRAGGETYAAIAADYAVSRQQVSRICRRQQWRHI